MWTQRNIKGKDRTEQCNKVNIKAMKAFPETPYPISTIFMLVPLDQITRGYRGKERKTRDKLQRKKIEESQEGKKLKRMQ